jgi:hypothetical protein
MRFGRRGEEKNSEPLLGLEPPIIQPVTQRYTTELSRLPLVLLEQLNQRSYNRLFIEYPLILVVKLI